MRSGALRGTTTATPAQKDSAQQARPRARACVSMSACVCALDLVPILSTSVSASVAVSAQARIRFTLHANRPEWSGDAWSVLRNAKHMHVPSVHPRRTATSMLAWTCSQKLCRCGWLFSASSVAPPLMCQATGCTHTKAPRASLARARLSVCLS
eukprot:6260672-Alexandrium_andersonii.AAC.1